MANPSHTHGFWKGSSRGLPSTPRRPEDLEWNPAWIVEPHRGRFDHLPAMNLARHHGGWNGSSDESMEDEAEKSRSPSIEDDGEASSAARYFPHPTTSIPPPSIEFDFRIAVRFDAEAAQVAAVGGESRPAGLTRAVGGTWSGSFGSGTVVAGAHDLDKASLKTGTSHQVSAAFRLQTSDENPATIELRTKGFLNGPSGVLESLTEDGERVDPRRYSHRMLVNLATTDARYAEAVNSAFWVGSGMWNRDELVIDAYRVA